MKIQENTFAAACYDMNSIAELEEALRNGPDEIVVLAAKNAAAAYAAYEAAIARAEVAHDEACEAARKAYYAALAKVD